MDKQVFEGMDKAAQEATLIALSVLAKGAIKEDPATSKLFATGRKLVNLTIMALAASGNKEQAQWLREISTRPFDVLELLADELDTVRQLFAEIEANKAISEARKH